MSALCICVQKNVGGRAEAYRQSLQNLIQPGAVYLLAGPKYNGYMNFPYSRSDAATARKAQLMKYIVYGSLIQKLNGLANAVISGTLGGFPSSLYGTSLTDAIHEFGLSRQDLVILPTSELDELASAIDASERLGTQAPSFHLRFIAPGLGERDEKTRRRRLASLIAKMSSPDISLYCETEELAAYFVRKYGLSTVGGFYLPCSIAPSANLPKSPEGAQLRIGIFGGPRAEKGSDRIGRIIRATTSAEAGRSNGIDFVIQGSPDHFGPGGAYDGLVVGVQPGSNVTIVPFEDRLDPAALAEMFLSVDAVLLPYDIAVYDRNGSGVIQDAAAAGKSIIHSSGFSMSGFLSHGNAVAARTDEEFAEAALRIAASRAAFVRGSEAARAYFQAILRDHRLLRKLAARP